MNYQIPFRWGAFIMVFITCECNYLLVHIYQLGWAVSRIIPWVMLTDQHLDNTIIFTIYQIPISWAVFIGVYHFCRCNDLIDCILLKPSLDSAYISAVLKLSALNLAITLTHYICIYEPPNAFSLGCIHHGVHHLWMQPFAGSYLSNRLGCWQNPLIGSAHRPASYFDNIYL